MKKENTSEYMTNDEDFYSWPKNDPAISPLASQILRLFNRDHLRWRLRHILDNIKAPRSTVKKCVHALVRTKHLRKHGKGKAVWYTLKVKPSVVTASEY
jgi:hypothetical protein